MKLKFIALALLAVVLYSCGTSKKVTPIEETKPATVVLNTVQQEGKDLFENNCAKCHRLYGAKEYSAQEWTPILARMQKKARLTDEDRDKIYSYVTMN
jgi:mono/diheme cytochrome c family protein